MSDFSEDAIFVAGVLSVVLFFVFFIYFIIDKERRSEKFAFSMIIFVGWVGIGCLAILISEKTTIEAGSMSITTERPNRISRSLGLSTKFKIENTGNTESEGFFSAVSKEAIMNVPKINKGRQYIEEIGKAGNVLIYKYKLPSEKEISGITPHNVNIIPTIGVEDFQPLTMEDLKSLNIEVLEKGHSSGVQSPLTQPGK